MEKTMKLRGKWLAVFPHAFPLHPCMPAQLRARFLILAIPVLERQGGLIHRSAGFAPVISGDGLDVLQGINPLPSFLHMPFSCVVLKETTTATCLAVRENDQHKAQKAQALLADCFEYFKAAYIWLLSLSFLWISIVPGHSGRRWSFLLKSPHLPHCPSNIKAHQCFEQAL